MPKSSIITPDPDWIHNPHAGEILEFEFMEPLGMTPETLAALLGIDAAHLSAVVSGAERLDADLDLRLARYFRMSDGFFLGLQHDHEILEARRELNGELERIVPRAA